MNSAQVDPSSVAGIADAIVPLAASEPLENVSAGAEPVAPPIDVLHVVNGEHYAGAERVQDLLAACLPAYGYRVGFACLKPGRFPDARHCQQAAVYRLPMASRCDLRIVGRLARLVRTQGYRLLHAHTPRSAMIARLASALTGVPMVYHVHSPSWRDSTRRWQDRVNWILERLSLTGQVPMIAVSASLARQMAERGFDPQRISVVQNGVPRARVADRQPPTGTWTLGAIGLWRPRKGMEVLLEALALLVANRLPVRLRVVGPFESEAYRHRLLQQAAALGLEPHVEWTGFRADVLAELAAMDLFVLPSLFGEGLPMVVLEAMSAGVPVVASRVEGVTEALDGDQVGLLADAGSAADLARALQTVVTGQRDWSQLRTQALARQIEQFSDQSMARGVAAVYDRLLAAT
jgi:glycosyltransferase involved in cell wall biosynthesis